MENELNLQTETLTGESAEGFLDERHGMSSDELHKAMTSEKVEARLAELDSQGQQDSPGMPSSMAAKGDIGAAFEQTREWLNLPLEERQQLSAASKLIDERKAEAAKLGVTLEEREAILAAEARKTAQAEAHEFEPVKAAYSELYPESKPVEVAQRYNEIDKFIRKEPVAGLRWLAEQYGVDPAELARTPQHQPQNTEAQVRQTVVDFVSRTPDWDQHAPAIVQAFKSGAVPITGDKAGDLARAYHFVKGKPAEASKPKKGKSTMADIEDTMRRKADAMGLR